MAEPGAPATDAAAAEAAAAAALAAVAAFRAALTAAARPRFADDASAAAVGSHWAAGRAAWPDVTVAAARYGAELARRLGDDAAPDALGPLRGADVYLAIAGAAGDPAAVAALEKDHLREVDHAARKLTATPDQIAEVKSHLRRLLFVEEPGRRAGLADFAGRGDLRGYVRVIATRELIRAINKGRREIGVDDEAVFDRFAPHSDAELSFLKRAAKDDVSAALRHALSALDERSRALLRYSLIDGWSIDRIGQLYGVHRATAARWLTAARAKLGELTRAEVAARLEIGDDEVDSIVRLVQSKVEVSFERLLGGAGAAGGGDAPDAESDVDDRLDAGDAPDDDLPRP